MMPWIKRIALALVVLLAVYVGVGTWYVGKLSQRAETWHDEAVKNSVPATTADWYATRRQGNPIIELRYRPKRSVLYLVRIYENGGYVSALHPGSSDVPPLRIETGHISSADRRALRERAAALYAVHEEVIQPADNGNPANARLTLVHEDRRRVLYRYRTAEYAALPQALRDYDARLFEAMRPWRVKPTHGYARAVPTLTYGAESIPALVRGLESSRDDLHASVVARLVDIGRPALPELTRVLREGEAARYRPASRYLAVVDGIGRLGATSGEGYGIVRRLATQAAGTPGERALRRRAREVIRRNEAAAANP